MFIFGVQSVVLRFSLLYLRQAWAIRPLYSYSILGYATQQGKCVRLLVAASGVSRGGTL